MSSDEKGPKYGKLGVVNDKHFLRVIVDGKSKILSKKSNLFLQNSSLSAIIKLTLMSKFNYEIEEVFLW